MEVVATTTIVADLVEQVGGKRVTVKTVIGPGVDPHRYRAIPADVDAFERADAVFHNGLGLEARLEYGIERMDTRALTFAVTRGIEGERLLGRDPHVWFDVELWRRAARQVRDDLSKVDRANASVYRDNAERYDRQLAQLDRWIREQVGRVPAAERVVVAPHAAFAYFARAYGLRFRRGKGRGLLTDSLGEPGSFEETYLGMVRSNVEAILSRSAGR